MEKFLIVYPDRCTGCGTCEVVCSAYIRDRKGGEYNPKDAFIKILKNEEMSIFIPVMHIKCNLCGGTPRCVKFCPTDALKFVEPKKAAIIRKGVRIEGFPAPIIGG